MGTIVSGSHTTGIVLNTLSSNPATITGTITLSASAAIGVHATTISNAWSIINTGVIAGTHSRDIGIEVDGGGTIYNGTATGSVASITAYSYGVQLGATSTAVSGLLINYGHIAAIGTAYAAAALEGGGTVVNAAGAFIGARYGALYYGVSTATRTSTVINAGTISGVFLGDGGTVSNAPTGLITGYNAIYAYNNGATVANAGTIAGGTFATANGIDLANGGTLVNAAGGTVEGATGVFLGGRYNTASAALYVASSLTNAGTIMGASGSAVVLAQGGQVSNSSTGKIAAAVYGVELRYSAGTSGQGGVINAGYIGGMVGIDFSQFAAGSETVINAGTIASTLGTSGTAIHFTNTADRLVVDQGAVFIGTVAGAGVLELGTTSGTAALSGIGSAFAGFSTIALDTGGDWLIGGNSSGFGATITGFTIGDTLDLASISATTPVFAAGTLALKNGSGTVVDTIPIVGSFTSSQFHLRPDASTGTLITLSVPCFVSGTRIATPAGEIAIEHLKIGDHVSLLDGASAPIKWIGRRSYNPLFIRGNRSVLPIVIRAGAIADRVPKRDLLVSPKHAMFFDGVLIPAENLIDGQGITQPHSIASLTYLHLELDRHAVIFAEGAPTESFVDCASRSMFQNAAEFAQLYASHSTPQWAFCAPRVDAGEKLLRVRRKIAARAEAAGCPPPLAGRIDTVDDRQVTGWARNFSQPTVPVLLEILDDDVVIGEVCADAYRPDLARAGLGDCSFIFKLSGIAESRILRARRKSDATELPCDPIVWHEAGLRRASLCN